VLFGSGASNAMRSKTRLSDQHAVHAESSMASRTSLQPLLIDFVDEWENEGGVCGVVLLGLPRGLRRHLLNHFPQRRCPVDDIRDLQTSIAQQHS